jgi:nicotinate-nucleotide adenylyltransferase
MKIAVYSGSFNPVHNGHLAIANAALAEGFDEVWMVISPQNPHKSKEELWPFEDRLKMVELAILDHPQLKASNCENDLPRPSYTINTLKYLKEKFPQHQFRLLIGEDNLVKFRKWKDYSQIIATFGLVVYPRESSSGQPYEQFPNLVTIKAPLLRISSSEIRKRLAENQSVSGLVPEEVEKYIIQKLKSGSSKPVF